MDWDEDAPFEVVDEEAVKPEGWLDNEPLTVADPGGFDYGFLVNNSHPILQTPPSLKSGTTRKMVTGSLLPYPTPSVLKPRVVENGNGLCNSPLLLSLIS